MRFQKTVLKNGICVISESEPTSRAVAMGIWVSTGTRDEKEGMDGISHYLEHLVFKGTKKRTAYQIAKSLEALGGELNAYTTREYTCYHALVLRDHWKQALEVLADLVTNMQITKNDFDVEKSVVLQEIAMSEDNLEELAYDIFLENCFGRKSIGRSILGYPETMNKISMEDVRSFYKSYYGANNLIIAAAGSIDHQKFVSDVEKFLGRKSKSRKIPTRKKCRYKISRSAIEKNSEQLHLLLGFPCSSFKDKMRFEAFVVNTLLGGGMTSKLYQTIREKRGLVYSVYSSLNTFTDFGMMNIYAACEHQNMKAVVQLIKIEIEKLKRRKISAAELELFQTQVRGSLLLGSQDVENRMTSIGINEMVFEEYRPIDQIIQELEAITVSSVNAFIDKYLIWEQCSGLLVGGGAQDLRRWFTQEIWS